MMGEKVLSEILEQLNNLTKGQQEMKNDIEEIKKQTEDIPAIKVAVLETKAIIERIESTQESHERILDLLSRRSIDQEAEIRRIK